MRFSMFASPVGISGSAFLCSQGNACHKKKDATYRCSKRSHDSLTGRLVQALPPIAKEMMNRIEADCILTD